MKFQYVVPSIFQDTVLYIINQQWKRILLGVQISQEDITKEEMFVIRDFEDRRKCLDLRQKLIILQSLAVTL